METLIEDGKERNSNLELYRIIVMLLIVAHHYVVNSGLWQVLQENELTPHSLFLYWFGMWGKTGINCFVLITGYFMCKSEATVHKFIKLLGEIVFYDLLFFLVFVMSGVSQFNLMSCFQALLPVKNVGDGFTSAFIFFYLMIPFLNKLIKSLDRKKHFTLVLLCVFVYTLWDLVPSVVVHYNYITWFIILYFIASFIRLYPNSKYDSNLSFWVKATIFLVLIALASVYFLKIIGSEDPYRLVSDTNAILALLIGISSFMLFKNLNIKQSKLINTIAASAFGVLLIHANSDTMRNWLWVETLKNVEFALTDFCILHSILSVILVYIVCTMIDYLRIRFIERRFLSIAICRNLEQFIENRLK